MKSVRMIASYVINILGYFLSMFFCLVLTIALPASLALKILVFLALAGIITWLMSYVQLSNDNKCSKSSCTITTVNFSLLCLVGFITFYGTINYRFNFMLRLTKSLLYTCTKKQITHPRNSLQLFSEQLKLLSQYLIHKDYPQAPFQDKLLGFSIQSFSHYDLSFLIHEIFAQEIYKFSTTSLEPFIIDCGSNIGISLLYFKSLYPKARIIGFEPDATTYKVLLSNIKNNNLDNITVHQKALHPTQTTLTFYSNSREPGSARNNLFEMFGCSTKKEIQATPLSAFITEPVDFLKIDIEGAEALILQELDEHQKLPLIKQMVFEFHPDKNSVAQTLAILEKNNFKYVISNNTKTPFSKEDADNLLLIYAYNQTFLEVE